MSRVLETVVVHHDLRLVLLAAVICAFGSLTTMNVSGRARGTRRSTLWTVLVALCAGATVWATHFIAMLAYLQDVPTTYDPALTALSFVSGVLIMGAGFWLAIRGDGLRWAHPVSGAVVGVGVVVLHYVGMAAVRMPGDLTYAPALVAASIVFSLGFGMPSLAVAFGSSRPHGRTIGALLMFGMVVSLHFTAMGAVNVHHGVAAGGVAGGVTRSALAMGVAAASLAVLLIGLGGAVIDQRFARRLAVEADRFRTLAEGAFEGLIVHRGGVIVDANRAARRLLDVPGGAIESRSWFDFVVDSGRLEADSDDEAVEVELERADGSRFPAEICRRRIRLTDGGEGELCAIRDLTARKEAEARIAHLALHDPLTELPNRRFLMELAQRRISQAQRGGDSFAVLVLDIDDFKRVNDTHGHSAGDEFIRATARRIAATLRDGDICARLGGDEFAIIETGGPGPNQTLALAERLLHALQQPIQLEYGDVSLTSSVGIALYPDDGATVEELLRNADTAMYRAKADGKSTSRFFEPHMDAVIIARHKLEHRLRRAIDEGRLDVAYQPIVEARGRAPLAFEALVRWTDEELGELAPAEFIPIAEDTGLIVPMGAFVLRRACMDARSWPDHVRVAVNLSTIQFRGRGLVETVREALEESGLRGDRLELEVTESLLMDNRDDALDQLKALKDLGVRISMDDFGTGYSSLSYLQSFPFDKLKIDRIFVTDLASNPQNASIVRAVAAMGRSLHMRVVAEGVETDHEADMLLDLDCDELQGFLVARPMAAGEVERFLAVHGGGERTKGVPQAG